MREDGKDKMLMKGKIEEFKKICKMLRWKSKLFKIKIKKPTWPKIFQANIFFLLPHSPLTLMKISENPKNVKKTSFFLCFQEDKK